MGGGHLPPPGLFNTSDRRDPMERLPRKERERQRRQREFLVRAEEIFSRKGFHSATIQEISEKSEFAVGSIYHMFRNKDEIYTALLQMRLEEYISLLEERIGNSEDPIEQVKALIEAKLQYFSEHKPFLKLFLDTTLGTGWDVQIVGADDLISRYEGYLRLATGIFEEGIKQKLFTGSDPIGMALAMEGMVRAFVTYWIRHEGDKLPLPEFSTTSEILLRGILKTNRNSKK